MPIPRNPETASAIDDSPAPTTGVIHLLRSLHRLHRAGSALLVQASLHGELARIEWQAEKQRLTAMLMTLIFGTASLLCVMMFSGLMVVMLCWTTSYRVLAVVGVITVYTVATLMAWRKLKVLAALGEYSFAATREELAADLAELRSSGL